MEEVQQFLSETFLDASRYALHSPYLPAMHECDTDIYLVMYAYFKKRSLQQKRETAIAITKESGVKLLRHVLLSNLTGQSGPLGTSKVAAKPSASWLGYSREDPFGSASYPIVTQRTLKDQMQIHKINCESFAEVLELCRRVEQKESTSSSQPPPTFGTANLLHFVAVALALVPSSSVEALVRQLFTMSAEAGVPLPVVLRMLQIWYVLDAHNKDSLRGIRDALQRVIVARIEERRDDDLIVRDITGAGALAEECLSGAPTMFMQGQIRLVQPQGSQPSGAAQSEVVDIPPPSSTSRAADASLGSAPLAPPKVVSYNEEDTGHVTATATPPQVIPNTASNSSDDDDVVDDEGKAFWAQLAS